MFINIYYTHENHVVLLTHCKKACCSRK